ncbi:MAG: hypothetical protein DRJ42_23865 [Deltaproteobacteria bacterium]|nr:MAG: hypothetical protein DRJ42_23865 [Deltaproteobacteria bacterium]
MKETRGVDEDKKRMLAIASVILGFIAIVGGVCLAACGALLAIIGIVLGGLAVKSDSKLIGIIGIVLNTLALGVVALNMVFTYGLMTGQVQVPGLPMPGQGPPAQVQDASPPDAGSPAPTATETALPAPASPSLAPWPDED